MLNSSIPDYEPISLRGSGAFGYVIEAYDKIHDARVAIKRTHKVGNKLSREYQILSELKDCDYIEVVQLPSRLIKVRSSHHDGTNVFYIKILTERGWTLYDNWDFGCRTKFANLTEYQILEKIWNDSHYSKRCAAA